MSVSFFISGHLAVYLQRVVKQVNGRFMTNLSIDPPSGEQYVCVEFPQPSTYAEFTAKLRIINQRFF